MKRTPYGDIFRLLWKSFLLGLPLLASLGYYVASDPFKVIWPHDFARNYYNDQPWELNREFASTELLLHQYQHEGYDGFILGSSRSFPFHCDEVEKYLPGARVYHYPAASENLYGLYRKVKFLDGLGVRLKHVLIVTDWAALKDLRSREDHLHILHPRVSGEGWLHYQAAFVDAGFSNLFLLKHADYRLYGQVRPYMHDMFDIYPDKIRVEPTTNDYWFEAEDRALAADPDAFYRGRKALFDKDRLGKPRVAKPSINRQGREYLEEMKGIFDRNGTDCRIVIDPMYDQVALNPADLEALRAVFGKDSVFDYSGVNSITADMTSFYDPGHIRPGVANAILRQVYGAEKYNPEAARATGSNRP